MTTEEARKLREDEKERQLERKTYLARKDWFALVDASKLYKDSSLECQKMWIRLSELGESLRDLDITSFSHIEKVSYKTNKCMEDLKELDY